MFAPVACERGRRFERVPRLRIAAELVKQVASNTWRGIQDDKVRRTPIQGSFCAPIDTNGRKS